MANVSSLNFLQSYLGLSSAESDSLKASNLFRVSFRTMAGSQPVLSSPTEKACRSSLPRQKIYRVPLSVELQREDFFQDRDDTRKRRRQSVLESHVGGRSTSTEVSRKKGKKLPRSARIIRSPSFESDKRSLVTKFVLHDGLSTEWKREFKGRALTSWPNRQISISTWLFELDSA